MGYLVPPIQVSQVDNFLILKCSGGFRGGALGASAPPGEPIIKKILTYHFLFSVDRRYLFACSVCPA